MTGGEAGALVGALVGIDVGGTKTHLRAVEASSGRTVADVVQTPAARPPMAAAAGGPWLAELVAAHVGVPLGAIAVGAHGCDTELQCARLADDLGRLLGVPAVVRNDAELLVAAAGFEAGAGVVVGTGTIAVGRRADGTQVHVGGWGWLLGDEGAAPALVREGVRAVLARYDAGDPPDALTASLLGAFDAPDPVELAQALSHRPDIHEWGRHAPLVFDAAQAGAPTAAAVIAAAGAALADLVVLLGRRGAATGDVVTGGGVIVAQPLLFDAFAGALAARAPASALHLLREPPVVGAVALARRLLAR